MDSPMMDAAKLDKILARMDEEKEDRKKMDARLDSIEKKCDSAASKSDAACAKMDAAEKEKMDSAAKDAAEKEEKEKADALAADAAKKDAEDKEKKDAEEKEKKDAAKDAIAKDAAKNDEAIVKAVVAAMSKNMPIPLTREERQALVSRQSNAERVYQAHGDTAGAPPFVTGESEIAYRIRLVDKFKPHCTRYKDVDLSKVGDVVAFDAIESAIYADSLEFAKRAPSENPRMLRQVRETNPDTGQIINKFYGNEMACWDQFTNPPVTGKINTNHPRYSH